MRILFVSTSSGSRGGGELYLIYLGQELAKRGHSLGLWCSDHPRMDELASQFKEFGEVLRSRYSNTYDRKIRSFSHLIPRVSPEIRQQWESFQPHLIHLNKQNLEDGLDLLQLANSLPYPCVATIHITQTQSSLGAFLGWGRDTIAKRSLRQFQGALVAISQTRGKNLSQFLESKTPIIKTIENGVRIPTEQEKITKREQTRAELGIKADQLLVVAIGRMEAQKRPLLFLEWANYLKALLPEIRFLWVGDGRSTPEWEQWVQNKQAGDYIQRLGWQTDVTPYLAAADAFFHPAEFEGLPFALLEAMAWSLPCFITPSLAKELSFPEGVCAIINKPDYTKLQLLANPTQRSIIRQQGYRLVEEQFSRSKMIEQYETLYHHLCAQSGLSYDQFLS